MTETQNVVTLEPCDAFVSAMFRVHENSVENKVFVQVVPHLSPGFGPREALLHALRPIAERIVGFQNCGCDRCASAKRTAEAVIAIVEKEDLILAGSGTN